MSSVDLGFVFACSGVISSAVFSSSRLAPAASSLLSSLQGVIGSGGLVQMELVELEVLLCGC